jgi:hypothetical protein
MKHHLLALASLTGVSALAGCPSDDGNPAVLWLALDGSELQVKLVGEEPSPY